MTPNQYRAAYPKEDCHYCGETVSGYDLCRDHIKPQSKGGRPTRRNLVHACRICNSIKGTRTIAEARTTLLQKRLGWPKFNGEQLKWLQRQGFDLAPLKAGKLAFEEKAR